MSAVRATTTWLRASRLGLVVIALVVGAGPGLAAVGFRWLIFAFTWLATGYDQFGQQGRGTWSPQLPRHSPLGSSRCRPTCYLARDDLLAGLAGRLAGRATEVDASQAHDLLPDGADCRPGVVGHPVGTHALGEPEEFGGFGGTLGRGHAPAASYFLHAWSADWKAGAPGLTPEWAKAIEDSRCGAEVREIGESVRAHALRELQQPGLARLLRRARRMRAGRRDSRGSSSARQPLLAGRWTTP